MSARLKLKDRLRVVRLARMHADKPESALKEVLEADAVKFGIDPSLIILFLQIGLAIWKYMQNKDVSHLSNTALYDAVLTEE